MIEGSLVQALCKTNGPSCGWNDEDGFLFSLVFFTFLNEYACPVLLQLTLFTPPLPDLYRATFFLIDPS